MPLWIPCIVSQLYCSTAHIYKRFQSDVYIYTGDLGLTSSHGRDARQGQAAAVQKSKKTHSFNGIQAQSKIDLCKEKGFGDTRPIPFLSPHALIKCTWEKCMHAF